MWNILVTASEILCLHARARACVFVFSVISSSVFHHEVGTVSKAQGHGKRVGLCVVTLT